ncbi:MAG TPA: OmpA family protein [Bacteroidetes bacterium]|nr:OmpA family protein [Bacteroidota bacterium]
MKLKFTLLILALFSTLSMFGQNDNNASNSDDVISSDTVKYAGTLTSPVIKDDMTIDPDQNKKWRKGLYKYPAKPKNAWELGLHGGHFFLDGDVDERHPLAGFGLGIHLRKAVHYVFSVRFDLFYGQTYGADPQPWNDALTPEGNFHGIFDDYVNTGTNWYPSYKMEYIEGSIQGVLNIGNILFHKERNKWNWIAFAGIGLNSNQTMMDLYDANGNIYNTAVIDALPDGGESRQARHDRLNKIKELYDGKYETKAYRKQYIFRVTDKYHIHASAQVGMGIYRKINKRVNIGLEHQTMINDNDYLDGMKYRTATDQSNQPDMLHYTNLRLAINLANFKKRTEPLYWMNPLEFAFNDIAQLKQRPVFDLTDSDADGVIDMMDMEQDSPAGCPVDTRGITLDSDGDGLADCKDKEPYSPPGYEVDEVGVAIIPDEKRCCVTKDEVRKMFEEGKSRGGAAAGVHGDPFITAGGGVSDWFLPMIHFDLDKYYIKNEYYGQLKHVADMMKKYPNLCVTAFGATDVRNSNAYNELLSYNRAKAAIDFLVSHYGIDRSRFNLMYGGEEKPLVPNLPDSHNISKEVEYGHYMNRRVEFRSCEAGDYDMPRPAGVLDAGQNTPNPSRPGSKYRGNKSSGF